MTDGALFVIAAVGLVAADGSAGTRLFFTLATLRSEQHDDVASTTATVSQAPVLKPADASPSPLFVSLGMATQPKPKR